MKKKRVLVIISFLLIVAVIGVGGKVFISSQKESKIGSEKVKKQIAEEFATKYLAPDNKDVNEVVFYKEPVDQADFTGNRTYFFYFNGNKQWKVGVSVTKETGEISAFGSDNIELMHKKVPKKVDNLTIKY